MALKKLETRRGFIYFLSLTACSESRVESAALVKVEDIKFNQMCGVFFFRLGARSCKKTSRRR